MADEVKYYPKGEVSLGGTLHEVTRVSVRSSNGIRLTHTITRSPAGWKKGVKEVTCSLSMEMPEGGQERDWFAKWLDGQSPDAMGVKLPGETRVLYLLVNEESLNMSPEDAVQREIGTVGWWG